jgi:sterol desaturase/sphingolipid hydroxylase (fatty acid hydroxylase superfamily)
VNEAPTLASILAFSSILLPAGFFVLAIYEALRPARVTTAPMALRWFGNVAVFVLGWPILVLFPFLSALGAAVIAREHGLGLLNVSSISPIVAIPLSVVALDFVGYWEHRLLHSFQPFWRLHALHHSDTDLDVATYIRHHPLEVLVQALFDVLAVIIFGFSAVSIALFIAITTIVQMIAHGNFELPKPLRWLAGFVVTPQLHRLHHSRAFDENNANFSNTISIWDRLFGTLRLQPRGDLQLGLPEFTETKFQRLDQMLMLPLLVTSVPLEFRQSRSQP